MSASRSLLHFNHTLISFIEATLSSNRDYKILVHTNEERSVLKGAFLINDIPPADIIVKQNILDFVKIYNIPYGNVRVICHDYNLLDSLTKHLQRVCLESSFNRFEVIHKQLEPIIKHAHNLEKFFYGREEDPDYTEILHYFRTKTNLLE